MSSVRDKGRQAEIDALAAEPERKPYSGAGSVLGGTLGRPEAAPSDARGRMAHRARREFVEEIELRPAAEAIAKVAAVDTEKILNDKRALTEFLCQPKPLDQLWAEMGQKTGCPLLHEFTRGEVTGVAANVFWNGAFQGFLNSEVFKPYRKTAIEKEVLSILLDFLQRNLCDITDVRNWQRTLLLFIEAHYALPWLQPKPAEPTAAERIEYTVGGRTLMGKAAIAAMSSDEMKRRLKEEPGFASLVEEIGTGKPLSTSRTAEETTPDPYTYNTTIVLRGFDGRDWTQREIDTDMSADKYRAAMKLIGKPIKTFEAVLDTDGFILAHLEARRAQWHR